MPKSCLDYVEFRTKKEATAFQQGIEYVNDSALSVVGIRKVKKMYRLTIRDDDKAATEETPDLARRTG
jgi:hypothetical protein